MSVVGSTHGEEPALLDYVVIAVDDQGGSVAAMAAMALSPRVMLWSPGCWLVDLRSTHGYWTMQARRRDIRPVLLLELVVAEMLGRSKDASGAGGVVRSMVFAPCPWQALLLSAHFAERGLSGVIELREPFSQALLRQVSWAVWLATARAYAAALAEAKTYRFNEDRFHQDLAHLEKAVLRLGQKHPIEMADAGPQAFQRRFGAVIAGLWQWTFAASVASPKALKRQQGTLGLDSEPPFASAFPWLQLVISDKPKVVRHLEHPVWSWDQLVLDLIADFDRLADLPAFAHGLAVVRLEWTLHLEDLSDCPVRIGFRHPHSLATERGQHQTALSQASHRFAAAYLRSDREQQDVPPVPLIGWTLVVEESLARPSTAIDLFGDIAASHQADLAMERIDNQLQVAVERYQVTSDWVVEEAFTSVLTTGTEAPRARPWSALAARRPLYLYATPRPLNEQDRPASIEFMERTGEVWWHKPEGVDLERNYFLIQSRFGQRSWATKDEAGRWWVHGLFA